MIISHKHKFIYIHCRKCAGSSIDSFFARHLGPEDLMIGSWNDAIKHGARFNRRVWLELLRIRGIKSFFSTNRYGIIPTTNSINAALKRIYNPELGGNATFPNANVLRDWVGPCWQEYFKFTFVRNPYARAVSDWKWRTRHLGDKEVSFTEFLMRVNDDNRPDPENIVPKPKTNWPLYTIDDRISVDFVGRVESIVADMDKVCSIIGIPFDPSIFPHAKKSSSCKSDYREIYTKADVDLAHKAFRKEIDFFNFSFR